MTREEYINQIIEIGNTLQIHPNSPKGQTLKKCIELLSAVPEREKGEWIPVSERLPDEEHEVYCQLSDGSNAVLYVQDNWGQMDWVDGMMGTGTYDVVAWREKPEPYNAESEG